MLKIGSGSGTIATVDGDINIVAGGNVIFLKSTDIVFTSGDEPIDQKTLEIR